MDRPMKQDRQLHVDSLKAYIEAGNYAPGDRLPAERELINSLGMTRNTLRRALDALEQDGVIWRHVGKGTFLSAKRAEDKKEINRTILDIGRRMTPVKLMRARLAIEPAIAREAAINASADTIESIRIALDGAENAEDWPTYESFDDDFHHAIARASDNLLLAELYDQLSLAQRHIAWRSVVRESSRPARTHTSFTEHRNILAAIEAHDSAKAHAAMRSHIGSVSARLFGEI
jgi:DNA-binding FadR family transcriptional regulator